MGREEVRMRLLFRRWATVFVGLAVLLLLAPPRSAFGRAGGGEGFDSGGGSSSDDDSSSDDSDHDHAYSSGDGKPLTAREKRVIARAVGVLAILLVGGICTIVVLVRRNNRRWQLEIVSRIQQSDPQFDPFAFAHRAKIGFDKIQKAWSNQDLSGVRAFLSDGVYERFSLQFDEQKALDYRNPTEPTFVLLPKVVELKSDGKFDVLTVRISASARDYRVRLSDHSKIAPDESHVSKGFVEYWTYARWTGAQTKPNSAGLIEGNCPNCGASIASTASAKCPACQAFLRSGEHDWVLTEITQAGEWERRGSHPHPEAQKFAAADPAFSIEELADTASVIFWRYSDACRTGKVDSLANVASEKFRESFEGALKGNGRKCYCECAVGSVTLASIARIGNADCAKLDIRWTGIPYTAGVDPRDLQKAGDRSGIMKWAFLLERPAGSQTDVSHALSSAHCLNCGAPDTGDGQGRCAFCGAIFHRQNTGWVLAEITK
jgi:hypothetical protein